MTKVQSILLSQHQSSPPIQATFFDLIPPIESFQPIHSVPSTPENISILDRFETFHRLNPHIFILLRDMALDMKRRGVSRYGMKGLFEILRWQYAIYTHGEGYKLNNIFTAEYARKLMRECPELDGFFETRVIRSVK